MRRIILRVWHHLGPRLRTRGQHAEEADQMSSQPGSLSLYESLTTTVWRMGDVNPLRRDPIGLVIARMCPQFDDACIATLSPAQHGQLALQTYADRSFSPSMKIIGPFLVGFEAGTRRC